MTASWGASAAMESARATGDCPWVTDSTDMASGNPSATAGHRTSTAGRCQTRTRLTSESGDITEAPVEAPHVFT